MRVLNAKIMHILGIKLVPEPSLETSDTLYTHADKLFINIRKSDALIFNVFQYFTSSV